ncbi:MAG: tetratricopeptide repeat protein, partial [Prevotella sp.]|nr:tetratricopeptide repeat protein [Prevotella sp.]
SLFSQIQDNRSVSGIIKELEPIYQSLDNDFTYHPWANDIAWNLAVAYVKDDQIDKAISILKKLKEDNPDTPIYTKANDLIKKLSDL